MSGRRLLLVDLQTCVAAGFARFGVVSLADAQIAQGINNAGQIVGSYCNCIHVGAQHEAVL
jgi:hypothetical protein